MLMTTVSSNLMVDLNIHHQPMEWGEEGILANRFSEVIGGMIGYQLEQLVADIFACYFDMDKK